MTNDLITAFLGIAIFLLIAPTVIMYTSMNAATAKKSGDKSDDSGNSKDSDSGGEWLGQSLAF